MASGALLLSSELVFTFLKTIGAAYLGYLGIRLLFFKESKVELANTKSMSLRQLFLTGGLSNISNPKVAIFYFAYLPQFVSIGTEEPAMQLLVLGASFAALTFLVIAPIGFFAGMATNWVRARPMVIQMINRTSGTVLICLGVKLALDQR